jgi:hypothetical protein
MPVNVNVPFQATIALDGTVSIKTIKAEQYNLGPADATFTGTLRDAILDAFVVSNNESSEVANVAVDVSGANLEDAIESLAFELCTAYKGNTLPTASNMTTLKQYLLDFATSQLNAQLATNGIADTLEADAVENSIDLPQFPTDMSGGSAGMFDGVKALNPNIRALLATQINNSKWESATTLDSQLPLYDGLDTMTFQFIITQHYAVSETAGYNFDISNNAVPGVGPGVAPTHYTVATRTIDLQLVRPDPSGGLIQVDSDSVDISGDLYNVVQAGENASTAVAEARAAHAAWAAKKALIDAAASALNYKNKAQDIYTKAQAVETAAVAAQGTMQTGPLYLAAQDAIAAATAAKTHLDEATASWVLDVSANEAAMDGSGSFDISGFRFALDEANDAVTTAHAAYVAAVATLNANKSIDDKQAAHIVWQTKQRAAHIESKLTFFDHCASRYEEEVARLEAALSVGDSAAEPVVPPSDVEAARLVCVAKEAAYVAAHDAFVALPALDASSNETQVAAASAAKKAENDAAIELRDAIAAHTALFADIEKIVDNINDNLRPRVLVANSATHAAALDVPFSDLREFPEAASGLQAYRVSDEAEEGEVSVRSYFPYDIAPPA